MAKVVKRGKPLRNWEVTIRWGGPQPGSFRHVVKARTIGDAIDELDEADDFDVIVPEDLDKHKVTSLHLDIKEVGA